MVPSTIIWTNRGQASDGFAVFGANANLARGVIDGAINAWTSLVEHFNQPGGGDTINVNISMQAGGYGGVTSITNFNNGWPTAANIGFGLGNNQGASYFLDPTPSESSEFQGTIVNAFSGFAQPGSPADGKLDLYTIAEHELCHALGFVAHTRLQTTGYATNTGVLDTPGHPERGYLWVFHGPSITHLTTSDNDGTSDAGGPEHTAYTNQVVTWQGQPLQGAEDLMNAGGGWSERRLIPHYVALMLHDAYNYTIAPVEFFPTFYVTYNQTTHNVLIRGSSGPHADTITVEPFFTGFSTVIVTTVAVGNPVPGTAPNPTYYSQTFGAGNVSSITVNTTAGADTVNIDDIFALAPIAPVTVNLGSGTDTVNILNLPPNPAAVTVNLGSGTDTVNIEQSFAPVAVNGGSGVETVNVQRTNAPVTLTLYGNNATVNIGHNGTVQDINGPVTIENPPALNVINIDDSADPAPHLNVIMDSFTPNGALFGRITGLAPATISYEFADTNSINIKTGTGSTVVNVLATGALIGTNLFSNGPTAVSIGNANSLWVGPGIGGALNLENEVSSDTVFIYDQNDTLFRTASLTTVVQKGCTCGRLSGLAAAPISWDYPDTTMVNINTGRGGVTLTVLGTGVPTFINGNTLGTNTLIGGNQETVWNVTSANAGNFSNALASATFSAFQNLTGGNDIDYFIFSNGASLSGTVNGGGGGNGLSMAAYTTNLTVNVTGANAGNVPGVVGSFINITSVGTGSGDDRFVFGPAGSLSTIDGGGGNNTLDASAVTSNRSVLVYGVNQGTAPGLVFVFSNIQNITTGSGNDTFVFSDGASLAGTIDGGPGSNTIDSSPYTTSLTYSISASNGGSVAGMVGAFANVQNIIGAGAGGNDFAFSDGGSLAGDLDGGVGGNNTLDYSAGWSGNVLVDLQTGTASGLTTHHLANIQKVRGASGGGVGFYNLLIGNGGNTLTGGFGRRNILVAGGSFSTLNGGDQDDLLIGGTTKYDADPGLVSWQAIAAYWAGTDDFGTRVANLTTGNGVPLLDATTVTGNGGGNTMMGNGELALIYTDGNDNITGFDPNWQMIAITP